MLPLYGVATEMRGFDPQAARHLIRLRRPDLCPEHAADAALVSRPSDAVRAAANGFTAALLTGDQAQESAAAFARTVSAPQTFAYLADGDVISVQGGNRRIRTLYRRNSSHNSFLVTERCNHYCLMCSQPPRDIEDHWILQEIRRALPLLDKKTRSLGFTGGEPLLDWRDLVATLGDCRDLLPETSIHVLSNGRAFASSEVTAAWAGLNHAHLTAGIPIYAAVDTVHDFVVQAKGAFDETVLGILKLKDRKQRVEVRVVLHAITAPRIVATCRWMARNLPFVDHVALMGLENTGFAIANDKQLWIDPMDYRDLLAEAVDILAAARVPASVYNLPRCVLEPSVWPYAAQSISDWKNDFLPVCEECREKPRCSGFFTTGRPRYSRGIQPIRH